jgi:hypothetical protein
LGEIHAQRSIISIFGVKFAVTLLPEPEPEPEPELVQGPVQEPDLELGPGPDQVQVQVPVQEPEPEPGLDQVLGLERVLLALYPMHQLLATNLRLESHTG